MKIILKNATLGLTATGVARVYSIYSWKNVSGYLEVCTY
jgi:hypothetical protein